MSTVDHFLSLFDELGRYKNGDGDVQVIFLTKSGPQYPGRFRFKSGLLVSAEMDGASPWGYPNESPLDGMHFMLHFHGERPQSVFVEQGRIGHNIEVQDRASKGKFLANFRVARNLFVHLRAEANDLTADTASVSESLTRGALWLTPKSVEGFNAPDFTELTAVRQAELQNAVEVFKAVASQIPTDKPPTKEQHTDAVTTFVKILTILSPYLAIPEESKKVEKALRNVPFPSWVVNWDYELASSAEGDAAVWVNVFADGNVARSDYGRFGSQIIPKIRQALTAEGIQSWPYVRLLTATEHKTA